MTSIDCFFGDSDEDGEMASDSDDEQSNAARAVVHALRSNERGLQFFRNGPKVYCPLCSNKEPLKDLQALWQHGDQNKDRWHHEVGKYIVTDVLKLPAGATSSAIPAAVKRFNDAKAAPKRPLGGPDDNGQALKAAKVYVQKRDLSEWDPLKIMWPPAVLVRASRESQMSLTEAGQIRDWMVRKANFRLLPGVKIHEGYRPTGHGENMATGNWLVTFPDRPPAESFLEAVLFDLVIREERQKNRERDGGLVLKGELVTTEVPSGWKRQYRLEGFRGKVLSTVVSQRVMLDEARTDAVLAEASQKHLEQTLEETAKEMTKETAHIKEKFEATMHELEEEKSKSAALREEYQRSLMEKEEEQAKRIAEVETTYRNHLNALAKQKEDEVAEQKEQMKMQHDLHQLRFEKTLKENMEKLESRHQHEKMLMWQRAEEQRAKDKEEYQKKIEQASCQKSKTQEINRLHIEQKLRWQMKQAHNERMQRALEEVRQHYEEEFENKLKIVEEKTKESSSADMQDIDYKKKLEEEMSELKDEMEFKDTLVNDLIRKERDSTDELNDMRKLLEKAHKEDLGHHWAFGTDGWKVSGDNNASAEKVFEDADCGFRQIGDLASDEKFKDTLWSAICRQRGLPTFTSREGVENLDIRLHDTWEEGMIELSKTTTVLQNQKVQDHNFNPFKPNHNFKSTRPDGPDNPKYWPTFEGMGDVREKYGDDVCHELRRVTIELVEVNGSGRYQMFVPWITSMNRKATPAEIIGSMEHRASGMQKLIMACKEELNWEKFENLKKRVPGTVKLEQRKSGRVRRG